MSLTITPPPGYTAGFNPIIVHATSNVRENYTIGDVLGDAIDAITSNNGYAQLTFISDHFLLKGDYILITSAPGSEGLEGIALVTQIINDSNIVINRPFITGLSDQGFAYKYLNNYNAISRFYIYVNANPTTPLLVSTKTLKPKFVDGFCEFEIDMSGLVKEYNFVAHKPEEVLWGDLYPLDGLGLQVDKKSFIKWGYELFEAFDNPVGGLPQYEEATA